MIEFFSGAPGSKKTALVVSHLDKIERKNKVNLVKNRTNYQKNLTVMKLYTDDFSYKECQTGSGHKLKDSIEVLDADYFSIFDEEFDDLRPNDYFKRAVIYNEIIQRINDRDGVQKLVPMLPIRTIYANINNLKIEFVRALDDLYDDQGFVDWRNAPDGSVIVIDEIQIVAPFDQMRNKNEPIIQDLTIHRHRGFDFKIISQAASLLHPTVKELVSVHYHLTTPYGLKTKVYQFGSLRPYPNTLSNKMNCETKFTFDPPQRIFKLYKSTTINTHKKRLPYKQLSKYGIFIVCAMALFFYGMTGATKSSLINSEHEPVPSEPVPYSEPMPSEPVPYSEPMPSEPYQVQNDNTQLQQDEHLKKYLPEHIIDMTRSPRTTPTAVMRMGDKCLVTNSVGERLNVDHDLCVSMSKDSTLMPKSQNNESPYTLNTSYSL